MTDALRISAMHARQIQSSASCRLTTCRLPERSRLSQKWFMRWHGIRLIIPAFEHHGLVPISIPARLSLKI